MNMILLGLTVVLVVLALFFEHKRYRLRKRRQEGPSVSQITPRGRVTTSRMRSL